MKWLFHGCPLRANKNHSVPNISDTKSNGCSKPRPSSQKMTLKNFLLPSSKLYDRTNHFDYEKIEAFEQIIYFSHPMGCKLDGMDLKFICFISHVPFVSNV